MKKLIIAALFLLGISISSNAQNAFDKEMREIHISAVTTCGMVKSQTGHDQAKILQSFQNLKNQIANIQKKYVKNPPAEYAKDPLFGSYFVQFDEIVNSQVALIEKENYKVAAMNCSRFCMTFQKMHAINGTLDLTDMMFAWNMQVTMTQYMINAGNNEGAQQNKKQIPMLYNKVVTLKDKRNNSEFNAAFKAVDTLYKDWLSAVESNDYKKAAEVFNTFSVAFPKVFKQSI